MPMQKKDHQKLVHHNHEDQSTTKACSCFLVSICFHQFQLGSNMPKLTALPSCNTLVDITKVYHSIVISRPEGQTQASQSSDLGLSIRNGCLLLASWCSLYHEFVGRFYTSRVWCRISSTALWLAKKWNWMGSFTVPFEVYVYSSLWSPDPWPGKHRGTTKAPPNGTSHTKIRFERNGWSPCAHFIGKFFLQLVGSFPVKLPHQARPGTIGINGWWLLQKN